MILCFIKNKRKKIAMIIIAIISTISIIIFINNNVVEALSKYGSRGDEVKANTN